MKDDDFLDAGRRDLAGALPELRDVRIADRAVHKPAELEVNQRARIGDTDPLASDGFQHLRREDIACFECHESAVLFCGVATATATRSDNG